MSSVIPITLVGNNLGERHLYLNTMVTETYGCGEDFDIIKNLPEQSPIDRLFKIDLASKVKNVDYIIQNFKEEDMLYVSRALKSSWLIDKKYEEIINPQYLEDILYPQMYTTAVTKMKHWTYLHLGDESRCREFYQYYKEKNFDLAIKFLLKCSKDDIEDEFPKVAHKITPHYFKVLCEKSSRIAIMFFNSIKNDVKLKNLYLNKEKKYFSAIKLLLKTDADMVLDITERYFNAIKFNKFSKVQTKFIMIHQKNRFLRKPELYTSLILNMNAIADCLNSEEAKDLVLKLARAKYLNKIGCFTYEIVEPLFKRVKHEERGDFKRIVFVDKNIGEEEDEWQYETPEPPVKEKINKTIFDDRVPVSINFISESKNASLYCRRAKKCRHSNINAETFLDRLYDEFRFANFEETLYHLRKRIAAVSIPQHREFMMLVLVSKSGGRPEAMALLLELLLRHSNEPPNLRAAIIRSLVKRANVWRLPEILWNQLLQFGQSLGLDGNPPVANCHEGLHAVIIRDMINTGECTQAIKKAYLTQFSTFSEYSLSSTEQNIIKQTLPKMLFSIAKTTENSMESIECIDKLINTLNAYKVNLDTYPGFIDFFLILAEQYATLMSNLINRLYNARVARKKLFRYTFNIMVSDASYTNALRHDITVLDASKFAKDCVSKSFKNDYIFLKKLAIYFAEKNGLAFSFLSELKTKRPVKALGRPLAFLLNNQLESYLYELKASGNIKSTLLASAIKANAHNTRPTPDITASEWRKFGVKHGANRYLKCPALKIDFNIEELLKSKRTVKLALCLSKRTNYQTDIFIRFATLKPRAAVKVGLKLLNLYGDEADSVIWDTMKPNLQNYKVTFKNKQEKLRFMERFADIDKLPSKISSEYVTVIYIKLLKKIPRIYIMPLLDHIERLLPDINADFVEDLLVGFLNKNWMIPDDFVPYNYHGAEFCSINLHIRILFKFIFLSRSQEIQNRRLETIGEPFFAIMERVKNAGKKKAFSKYFYNMICSFRYNKVILDTQFVSPLPVMEKALAMMHKLYSADIHFETFTQLHLSMLYLKAVRRGLELYPDVFADEKRKRIEGVTLIGKLFGNYVSQEVATLKNTHFDSIIELYVNALIQYLHTYLFYVSSDLLSSIIQGILDDNENSNYRLVLYLLKKQHSILTPTHFEDIKKYMAGIKDNEFQLLACALFPSIIKK